MNQIEEMVRHAAALVADVLVEQGPPPEPLSRGRRTAIDAKGNVYTVEVVVRQVSSRMGVWA